MNIVICTLAVFLPLCLFNLGAAQSVLDFEIGVKTLILSSSTSLARLPLEIAKAYGVEYDIVSVSEEGILQFELFDPMTSKPKYNSIVQTSALLGYSSDTGWVGNGIGTQKAVLDDYCAKYNVRRVMLNSGPYDIDDPAIWGLQGRKSTASTTVTFTPGATNQGINNAVRAGGIIKIGSENEFSSNPFYITPAYIDDAKNADTHIEPLLTINFEVASTDTDKVKENVGNLTTALGGVIHREVSTGTETMYFFFTASLSGLHGPTLAHAWFPWVTRGLFLGNRMLSLGIDIDDFYLSTRTYNEGPKIRTTATDYAFHAAEQDRINAGSSPGSSFRIQMAFNGKGYGAAENRFPPEVNPYTVADFDKFFWVSHTWSHNDMYCYGSNCAPNTDYIDPQVSACHDWRAAKCLDTEPTYPQSGYTSYEYSVYELTRNMYFASTVLGAYARPDKWSPSSIVTPRISGLNYTEAVRAMLEAGHRYATGDNSRDDLKPNHPWHPFIGQVQTGPKGTLLTDTERQAFEDTMQRMYGQRSIIVIPRIATEIYFDAATPQQLQDEFNSYHGPTCYGYDQSAGKTDGGYKCTKDSWKYPRDLTTADIMEIEGFRTAKKLLGLRNDPYMFHQANLAVTNGTSLLSLWLNAALRWINAYVSFPIVSLKMDDLAVYFLKRKYRDECGLQGTIRYLGGVPVSLAIAAQGSCDAVFTHTSTSGSELYTPRVAGRKYGELDTNYYLPMVKGRTTVVQLGVAGCQSCTPT